MGQSYAHRSKLCPRQKILNNSKTAYENEIFPHGIESRDQTHIFNAFSLVICGFVFQLRRLELQNWVKVRAFDGMLYLLMPFKRLRSSAEFVTFGYEDAEVVIVEALSFLAESC